LVANLIFRQHDGNEQQGYLMNRIDKRREKLDEPHPVAATKGKPK
jgi:hypothetical protein